MPRFLRGPRRPAHALVVCALAAVGSAPGQTILVGLFNQSLREATGLAATGLSSAYLAATLASAATMPFAGRLSDRMGPHRLMAVAAVGLAFACMGIGQVHNLWTLILGFYALRLFGQGLLTLTSAHTLAMWFHQRLGMAEGIRGASLWVGFAILPQLVVPAIAGVGWQVTYLALGLAVAGVVTPLALLLGSPPRGDRGDGSAPLQAGYTLGATLRTGAYWVVTGQSLAIGLGATALLFHLQPLLGEMGLQLPAIATALSAASLGAGASMLAGGVLADRVDERRILAGAGLLLGVATLALTGGSSPVLAVAAMGAFGIGQGLHSAVAATVIARWFGRARHGTIRGTTSTLVVAGTAVGPLLLSLGQEQTGSWQTPLVALAAVFFALGIGCALIRRPPLVLQGEVRR